MKYQVNLNGKTYEVEVNKGQAILVDEYNSISPQPLSVPTANTQVSAASTVSTVNASNTRIVNAPIAGTILSIKANVGQVMKKGDIVLIIEAMKMENEIVAPRDGKLINIFVTKGNAVSNGSQLFELA